MKKDNFRGFLNEKIANINHISHWPMRLVLVKVIMKDSYFQKEIDGYYIDIKGSYWSKSGTVFV